MAVLSCFMPMVAMSMPSMTMLPSSSSMIRKSS